MWEIDSTAEVTPHGATPPRSLPSPPCIQRPSGQVQAPPGRTFCLRIVASLRRR